MLARLTGKQEYYDKAKRALVELYKRRSPIGLVGSEIDVETAQVAPIHTAASWEASTPTTSTC